jgi:hypothetical protein
MPTGKRIEGQNQIIQFLIIKVISLKSMICHNTFIRIKMYFCFDDNCQSEGIESAHASKHPNPTKNILVLFQLKSLKQIKCNQKEKNTKKKLSGDPKN